MITESLSTLKINKMSQKQFERELAAGNIEENALYLTPVNDEQYIVYIKEVYNEESGENEYVTDESFNWDELLSVVYEQKKQVVCRLLLSDSNEDFAEFNLTYGTVNEDSCICFSKNYNGNMESIDIYDDGFVSFTSYNVNSTINSSLNDLYAKEIDLTSNDMTIELYTATTFTLTDTQISYLVNSINNSNKLRPINFIFKITNSGTNLGKFRITAYPEAASFSGTSLIRYSKTFSMYSSVYNGVFSAFTIAFTYTPTTQEFTAFCTKNISENEINSLIDSKLAAIPIAEEASF